MKNKKILLWIISALLALTAAGGGLYWGLTSDSIFQTEKSKEELLVDVGWYSEEGEEFIISTVQELYDVAALSAYYSFEGQTIRLGSDIVVNEGDAAQWGEKAPTQKWWPIHNFAGTFDGDGHTISGLYGYAVDYGVGLFNNTKPKAVIRNFSLKNSYFCSGGAGTAGAISSNGAGTFSNIYTNAIVTSDSHAGTGGFIGKIDAAGESAALGYYTRITGCWFDGKMILTGNHGAYGGGFVGQFSSGTLEIKQCLSSGEVSCTTTIRGPHIGGFVGDTNVELGTLILHMEGCLNTTSLTTNNINCCGSVLGRLRSKCTASFANCYATAECWSGSAVPSDENTLTGNVLCYPEKVLTGNGGYEWTDLDFDTYWTVTEDATPVLRAFADQVLSTEGLQKGYSTDWYNEYADEFVIDSREKLMGLFVLSAAQGVTFRGQIIKLADDFTLNTGNSNDWVKDTPSVPWISIGSWTTKFEGTFDGQGHTISGVYLDAAGKTYVGLFGVMAQGSTVKNLRLTNSYIKGGMMVGSIVGRSLGNVDSVYSNATVVSTKGFAGGIMGQSLEPKDVCITHSITNCWFDGAIDIPYEGFANAGGILGENRNNNVTIAHCLFTGTINSESTRHNPAMGGIIGMTVSSGTTTITDCLSTGLLRADQSGPKGCIGSLAGQLNGETSKIVHSYATTECWEGATMWGSNFKTKAWQYPAERLKGYGGYQWTTLDFNNYWAVVKDGTPILKRFASTVPSVAGVERLIDINWYNETKNTYVINTKAELLGLSMLAASTDFEGKTIQLGADITVNKGDAGAWDKKPPLIPWTPVGTAAKAFAGTFDGKGHTVSGLYANDPTTDQIGMFGKVVSGATIKNFKLVNSYICGANLSGAVIGRGQGCTVESVYTDAKFVSAKQCVGGIMGSSWGNDVVKNCWFAGAMNLTHRMPYGGGIVGENRQGTLTVENCLFSGSITASTAGNGKRLGGIVGSALGPGKEGDGATIRYCLATGTITSGSSNHAYEAPILGLAEISEKVTVSDCYATTATGYSYLYTHSSGYGYEVGSTVAPGQLTGANGYVNTTLDFKDAKYWVAIRGGTPELTRFSTGTAQDLSNARRPDTSWYDTTANKTFEITTKEQLLGFVKLAQQYDFKTQTIELGANITVNTGNASTWGTQAPESVWTPVGTSAKPFAGTFDGQGHTISGLYANSPSTDQIGMFGKVVSGATIKNFKLVNSYICGGSLSGAVVGRSYGATVESVYTDATFVSAKQCVGGIVGSTWGTAATTTVRNCWFAGTMTLTHKMPYGGGIVGENRESTLIVENCLFTGSITASTAGNGKRLGGIVGSALGPGKEGVGATVRYCLATGTITSGSSNHAYEAPILGLAEISEKVAVYDCYATTATGYSYLYTHSSGYGYEVGTAAAPAQLAGVNGYLNTTLDFKEEKIWAAIEDGTPELAQFSTGTALDLSNVYRPDTSWYDTTANKTFEITTKEQFLGFLQLSQQYDFKTQTVKLGTNITLNTGGASTWGAQAPESVWVPIGTASKPFAGTFDGQGHTVSGLYVNSPTTDQIGMFGKVAAGATVKNFKLTDSYICGANLSGAVIGRSDGATVENVYTNATFVSAKQCVGGIVGSTWGATATTTVRNCWFAGTMTLTHKMPYGGGIVGENRNSTLVVENCLFSGSIAANTAGNGKRLGGIVGSALGPGKEGVGATIRYCLATGTITSGSSNHAYEAPILGLAEISEKVTVSDCYATTTTGYSYLYTHSSGYGYEVGTAVAPAQLTGVNGYLNTTLDFKEEKIWAAIEDGTPELAQFSTGTVLDLSNVSK